MHGFYVKKVFFCFSTFVLCCFLTNCKKTTLSNKERHIVDTKLLSVVVAKAYYNAMDVVWDDLIYNQIYKYREEYVENLYSSFSDPLLSDLALQMEQLAQYFSPTSTVSYHVEWVDKVIEEYIEVFSDVQKELANHLSQDYQTTYKYMRAVYELYHLDSSDSSYSELYSAIIDEYGSTIHEKAPFDGWNQFANGSRWAANISLIDSLYLYKDSYDIKPILFTDFKLVDHLRENNNYFAFVVSYNILNSIQGIAIDYIVKEPGTNNSFQIGFNNFTAYLCTFSDEDNVRMVYEPIEYQQVYIGKGL